jgi:gamma-glutamyltranspeptidase
MMKNEITRKQFLAHAGAAAAALLTLPRPSLAARPTTGKYCDTPSRCISPMTTHGMVTSPNYLATEAGLEVLKRGGNAVDAAIAVSTTLSVVYPLWTSFGASNFWTIYNAKTKELRGLDGNGPAGEQATIEFFKNKGMSKIPERGYLSAITVPGAVAGWSTAHEYADKNMEGGLPWRDLFNAAFNYAQNGFPVTPSLAKWEGIVTETADRDLRDLQRFDGFRKTFLRPDGSTYKVGDVLKLPELANTIKQVAEGGADVFYKGEIAKKIVADLHANGGLLTSDDFANTKARWVKPIGVNYRGYQAVNLPPPTQGIHSLEILNILNNFDVRSLGEGTAGYYHLLVEAIKQSLADRGKYVSDPDFVKIPVPELVSVQHGKDQAAHINMDSSAKDVQALAQKAGTVWFGAVDKYGNAVSAIQSVYYPFGSGIVPEGTGVLLLNRGHAFSLDPNSVNRLEPHKYTFTTLNPPMLLKDGKPYLVYGSMGGDGQPQTQAMIVTRIVDFGMSPQDAINAPRFLYGPTEGIRSNALKIEGRVPTSITDQLNKLGHTVERQPDFTDMMGHAGAILIDPENGMMYGATDPRSDGLAAGY